MRRNKTLSILLIVGVLCSLFAIPASASVMSEGGTRASLPEDLSTKSYAVQYFSNLTTNFGNNTRGSCELVAAAMLLSFYDTYWNDDFIPEHYESNSYFGENTSLNLSLESPGIFSEPGDIAFAGDALTNAQMMQFTQSIEIYSKYYFHFELLRIGLQEYDIFDYSDMQNPCGTYANKRNDVLEDYLFGLTKVDQATGETVPVFSTSQITLETCGINDDASDNEVLAFIIEKVSAGIPVIVDGGPTSTDIGEAGHAFIAYDCDENGNIYCHMGWNGDDIYNILSTSNFGTDLTATCLNIQELPHKCSNNYRCVTSESNEIVEYCSCVFGSHPEHQHTYVNTNTTNTHTYTCLGCGYNEAENHSFSYTNVSELEHSAICSDCGYSITDTHSTNCTSTSSTQHCLSCNKCDYEFVEAHSFGEVSYTANGHEKECSECNYVSILPHFFITDSNGVRKCKLCGYIGYIHLSTTPLLK